MKKFKIVAIAVMLAFLVTIPGFVHADETVVTPNKLIVFKIDDLNYYTQEIGTDKVDSVKMDAAPMIKEGRTFVPVRFLGNALGIDNNNIIWNNSNRTATLKSNNELKLTIGKKAITINNEENAIDVAPMIVNPGRTMLPARYVAEGLGFKVDWDENNRIVICYPEDQEKPSIDVILNEINKDKKPEQNIPVVLPETKIKGTPFYQATPEQIEACKNAPMPSFTTKDFNQNTTSSKEAAYRNWNYRFNKVPYKFITDKSLVYRGGSSFFRGYIDMNDGKGLRMADLLFWDKGCAIVDANTHERLELIEWWGY